MLLQNHINFDRHFIKDNNLQTDIIGQIEDIEKIFKSDTFMGIICYHVLEHFYPEDGRELLHKCYRLLKPGGVLAIECPDISKIVYLAANKLNDFKNIENTINEIYGDAKRISEYGESFMHKWGWTKDTCIEYMKRAGFKIKMSGDGISHNHMERDFRVEGIKA